MKQKVKPEPKKSGEVNSKTPEIPLVNKITKIYITVQQQQQCYVFIITSLGHFQLTKKILLLDVSRHRSLKGETQGSSC